MRRLVEGGRRGEGVAHPQQAVEEQDEGERGHDSLGEQLEAWHDEVHEQVAEQVEERSRGGEGVAQPRLGLGRDEVRLLQTVLQALQALASAAHEQLPRERLPQVVPRVREGRWVHRRVAQRVQRATEHDDDEEAADDGDADSGPLPEQMRRSPH